MEMHISSSVFSHRSLSAKKILLLKSSAFYSCKVYEIFIWSITLSEIRLLVRLPYLIFKAQKSLSFLFASIFLVQSLLSANVIEVIILRKNLHTLNSAIRLMQVRRYEDLWKLCLDMHTTVPKYIDVHIYIWLYVDSCYVLCWNASSYMAFIRRSFVFFHRPFLVFQ